MLRRQQNPDVGGDEKLIIDLFGLTLPKFPAMLYHLNRMFSAKFTQYIPLLKSSKGTLPHFGHAKPFTKFTAHQLTSYS